MKHTKGPWKADGADVLAPETRFRTKDEPLAMLNVEDSNWPFNAAIMAAAPEMYDLLRIIEVELADDERFEETRELWEKVRAVLGKAEGKL